MVIDSDQNAEHHFCLNLQMNIISYQVKKSMYYFLMIALDAVFEDSNVLSTEDNNGEHEFFYLVNPLKVTHRGMYYLLSISSCYLQKIAICNQLKIFLPISNRESFESKISEIEVCTVCLLNISSCYILKIAICNQPQ